LIYDLMISVDPGPILPILMGDMDNIDTRSQLAIIILIPRSRTMVRCLLEREYMLFICRW